MTKQKQNNYWWLVGVDLGGYVFDGCSLDQETGLHQYNFIDQNNQLQSMYYKRFKKYISAYDLLEYKKVK